MKKILVLTLLLVALPYTFFPENQDWYKLDQHIGRCYSTGASTIYFGLVLWRWCDDLDQYLFFIKQNKAGAAGIYDYTYAEMNQPRITEEAAQGIVIGIFLGAPMTCPSHVTPGIMMANMASRVARGVNSPSNKMLVVFYGAAQDVGCTFWEFKR